MRSIWSSASARLRSGSTATKTGWRDASWNPFSTACRPATDRARSSAPSAISRTSPTSPRTRTTSARCAARGAARAAAEHAARRPLAHARERPASAPPICAAFFEERARSVPVLTAHPTEVRRKSTIDREMEIAALLDRRERVQLTPEESEASDEQLRRARADAVADQPAAPDQAHRARRGRERPVASTTTPSCTRCRGCIARWKIELNQDEGGDAGELASFLTHGKLDRRRPRRQPVRHRRRDARHACGCSRAGC